MTVPPPFGAKSELSSPCGTASSDYTKMTRELNAEEVKKLEEMRVLSETVVQPNEMPSAGSLLGSNIHVITLETQLAEKGVLC